MRSGFRRALFAAALVVLASGVFAAVRLTPAVELNPAAAPGPAFGFPRDLTATRVQGGYVAAWSARNEGASIALLDGQGVTKRLTRIEIPGLEPEHLSASDGVDALIAFRTYETNPPRVGAALVRVRADGGITQRSRYPFALQALTWNGTSYIAVAFDRILEFDRDGFLVAEALPGADFRYRVILYADGPRVWTVRKNGTRIERLALTDDAGHVISSEWVELPFAAAEWDHLMTAGADGSGMFLLTQNSYGENPVLQFLDRDGAPNAEPVRLDGAGGFSDVHTVRGNDDSLLILDAGQGRLARIAREFRSDTPVRGDLELLIPREIRKRFHVTVATLPGFRHSSGVLFPTAGGAVFIGMATVAYDGLWTTPAATHIHARRNVLAITRTEALVHAKPDMRRAAAAVHGDGFLVAWQQSALAGPEIWIRNVDLFGQPQGPARFLGAGAAPQIASRGDLAMVVWTRTKDGVAVEAMRIGRNGSPIDSAPVTLAAASGPVTKIGFDAMQFNIFFPTASGFRAAMVPADGNFDAKPSVGTVVPLTAPDVIGTAPGHTLFANLGSSVEAFTLRHDLSQDAPPRTVSILGGGRGNALWNGTHFVLAWWHSDHLRFSRISTSGEPLDSEYGQVLGNLPIAETRVSPLLMVFRDNRYVVATDEQVAILEPGSSGEGVPLAVRGVEALVVHPDNTILLVTSASKNNGFYDASSIHVRKMFW